MNIEKKGYANIFSIPKKNIKNIDFISCKEPRQTLEQVYQQAIDKPDILINGGFFNMTTGTPVMDFIDDYDRKSADSIQGSYGIGVTTSGELKFGKDDEIWKDFLTAYPPLLIDGVYEIPTIAKEIDGRYKRTVLGYGNDNIVIIVYDYPGATFAEAAADAKAAGCTYAVNLDGGGSTRLLYNGKVYAGASINRPVDNVVAFYLQPQIYRVQLGAFSSKENANRFCEQIKQLKGVYNGAYVRYVKPYYKVQVGAFAIYSNAQNMLNDLKNKGYNAFITVL